LGPDAHGLPLDVTSEESFAEFLAEAALPFGPVDVLVNNAGVMLTGAFLEETETTEARMIGINLHGVILGCKLAGADFARRGSGHIINIASMAGVAGFPGVATYCATKFGVVGLTSALREELLPHRIKVTAICPGIVHTELSAGVKLPGLVESFSSVDPDDIAAAVVSAISTNPAISFVPERMRLLLRTMQAIPENPRRALSRLLRADQAYLNVDQSIRDAYHRRGVTGDH
jgi:short-subunit dehydrogenase